MAISNPDAKILIENFEAALSEIVDRGRFLRKDDREKVSLARKKTHAKEALLRALTGE